MPIEFVQGPGFFLFHQTPEFIGVHVRDQMWVDTIDNFMADFGLPAPALPDGATARVYELGKSHTLLDGDVSHDAPMPWPPAQAAFDRIDMAMAAKEERRRRNFDSEIAKLDPPLIPRG
jgi:hypothetical protein